MKKTIYFIIVVFIVTMFALQSCKKDTQVTNPVTKNSQINSSFEIQNGRLVFQSVTSLDSQALKLGGKTQTQLESWEQSINFKSYRAYVQNIIMKNWTTYCVNHDTVTPEIEFKDLPVIYKSILNQKGEIQVKDTVYYFTSITNVYAIHYTGETDLQSIEASLSNQINNQSKVNNQQSKAVYAGVRGITLRCDTLKNNITTKKDSGQNIVENNPATNANFPGTDADYQGPFSVGGFNFKFVFQTVVQGSLNSTPVIQISSFLQYWHSNWYGGGSWNQAGQQVEKYDYLDVYITTNAYTNYFDVQHFNTNGSIWDNGTLTQSVLTTTVEEHGFQETILTGIWIIGNMGQAFNSYGPIFAYSAPFDYNNGNPIIENSMSLGWQGTRTIWENDNLNIHN